MPKVKVRQYIKVNIVVNKFSAEFSKTPINELFCKLCDFVVTCSKKTSWTATDKQLSTKNDSLRNQKASRVFSIFPSQDFATKATVALLSADIPLYKLNNPELKQLFAAEERSMSLALLNWSV